ncbi:hypothetical protein G9P44_001796 [Scheffersomyces stipitis]|nr:hypothetical protein G9P44_001796 [Scheffersomyces stipitis]
MSFSPEILKKKLASLQDTQDSIVSISQWVLFHHRHSADSAKFWSQYTLSIPTAASANLKNPSSKKLSLLYLCNDVVQQARRKRKLEFINDFATVLPAVLRKTFYNVDSATKPKIERLISVWEQRQIFSPPQIAQMKEALRTPPPSTHNGNSEKSTDSSPKSSNSRKSSSNSSSNSTDSSSASVAPELNHLNELFLHLNQLTDISQANLTQFGIQSKTYLPSDPSMSENLPSPKIYISKLNMLEKLSKVSIVNIKEIKDVKLQISNQLENLSKIISEGTKTEDSKISIINDKLIRLNETREELKEMLDDGMNGASHDAGLEDKDEEPSPSFETTAESKRPTFVDDDDNDDLPTYENDDEGEDESNSDNELPSKKKRRLSQTPSGGSTPSSLKRVAFSEDIEVKEFDREEQTDIIKIVKSDDDTSDFDVYDSDNDELDQQKAMSSEFGKHHKDVLELKHQHDAQVTDEDEDANEDADDDAYSPSSGNEYDPGSTDNDESRSTAQVDIMSLLSKLA